MLIARNGCTQVHAYNVCGHTQVVGQSLVRLCEQGVAITVNLVVSIQNPLVYRWLAVVTSGPDMCQSRWVLSNLNVSRV